MLARYVDDAGKHQRTMGSPEKARTIASITPASSAAVVHRTVWFPSYYCRPLGFFSLLLLGSPTPVHRARKHTEGTKHDRVRTRLIPVVLPRAITERKN